MEFEGIVRNCMWMVSGELKKALRNAESTWKTPSLNFVFCIRNCKLPEDGAGSAPKRVGSVITF
jgi:hypothetical protein